MELLKRLETRIKEYSKDANFEIIERAYLLAKDAHKNQTRYSGEPYISHPLEVAFILADLHMDTDTICAAILHDVIEDTSASYEMIKTNFNENIANLVDGVTKIGKLQFVTKEQREAENLRKMVIAMANDVRVVIIKLADRLHNMRTLSAMRPDKQKQKAKETLDIYAPIAHRLGISKIKWELEDLALLYLDPEAYHDIARKVALKREEREAFIDNVKYILGKVLKESGIKAKIEGRPKHFYSIYRKMKKGKAFEEIYDLFAIRVLVDSIKDCYGVLGMAHTLWNPMPGRFKDYIAMPKPNMYQSLHTTVFTKGSEPFEIQIRTYEMHRTAEYGIAAHWKYKEGTSGKKDGDFEKRLIWIRELMEMENELENSDEFMEGIKFDLFTDEVFVFTPNSKVIQLPSGACPIDFAYRIHSDIGNQCVGAKVNGKMVPLTYKLQNGDIVNIITSPNSKGPSRDWLNIVKSSHAKTKIKTFFKKADREENIIRGKEALEKEVKKDGYSLNTIVTNGHLEFVKKRFNVNTWDDLYSAIGYGGLKSGLVFQRIKDNFKEEFNEEEKEKEIKLVKNKKSKNENAINVQGYTDLAVFFSNCCNPVPGDNIVGYITKNRGVSIHRADCINVGNSINQERLINVSWNRDVLKENKTFEADIKITANDRIGLSAEITTIISNEGFNMSNFSAASDNKYGSVVNISLHVHNTMELEDLFRKLKNVQGIKEVYRV
ncbi:bifunctional (p)ppGpp synthetase/guanosine-3',5'-bis(diphosphate) 3'-pyrophosphohydrolase [Anaerofustis sp.]|uniref:RelA/SpoT family protein n=1 Tax=Anaerofustis sp. TaxID=1872517 RepID=UPI0025BBDF0D|nr:bifunctional (p)ppGpp synthetase/guanosine-3',5'-bis(diphosphate) 3'-pyrophosphohydrolase [Anaerofustis sp.]